MKKSLPWTAVALMLTGAVMLVADVGVAGLWIEPADYLRRG